MEFASASFSVLFAVTTIVLMSLWAAPGTNEKYGYLGSPSWTNNLFACHPTLMVCGAFPAIILAVNSSSIFPAGISVVAHITFQFIATIFICVGISAIVLLHDSLGLKHLRNSHTWTGVVFLILFFVNIVIGIVKVCIRESDLTRFKYLRQFHSVIGTCSVASLVIAISTGIQIEQSSVVGLQVCSSGTSSVCRLVNRCRKILRQTLSQRVNI